ncbi:hypothetical protein BH10ACI2_BH10ACI2_12880 [soil metagenome]
MSRLAKFFLAFVMSATACLDSSSPITGPEPVIESPPVAVLDDTLVIPGLSLGALRLGESIDNVYKVYPLRKNYDQLSTNRIFKIREDGVDERTITCADEFIKAPYPDDVSMFVYFTSNKVVQLEGSSSRFHTANGIFYEDGLLPTQKKLPNAQLFVLRNRGGADVGWREPIYLVDPSGLALEFLYFEKKNRRFLNRFTVFPSGGHFEPGTCTTPPQTYAPITPEELVRSQDLQYPSVWFAAINDSNKPDWEILPQEAKAGEVILSKRNELGILSNFAATPFELYGKRYASVEGFWQMMLYPEGTSDERARDKRVTWKYTREQVAQMTAFEAKSAGTLAEENMKTLGIDWVTFEGKRFPYRSATPGEHYRLILAAMRAKVDQNPEVKRILLATGDLILKPDHHGEENPPPEWKYYDIWMQIRTELRTKR